MATTPTVRSFVLTPAMSNPARSMSETAAERGHPHVHEVLGGGCGTSARDGPCDRKDREDEHRGEAFQTVAGHRVLPDSKKAASIVAVRFRRDRGGR